MMQNNIKVAITGGICSGKSTVAKFIKEQGYNVISCDDIYCELLSDSKFLDLLENEFGNIKNTDGTLNRAKLSEIVFSDDKKLKKLNSITHPKIMQRAMRQMSGEGIFFCEVPLLFEGGYDKQFDGIIVVLRDKRERIRDLMSRNNIDENQAFLRINNQFEYQNADFTEYYVIHNNGSLSELRKKSLEVVAEIIKRI